MGVRNLHNFIYCPRLFYYQWVENIFQENADTVEGSRVHRNVDEPSRFEDPTQLGFPSGSRMRSLRLESESLGLVGVVDIVEGTDEGAQIVDYKKGSARKDAEGERVAKEPDAVQVAAHALLLRERGVNVSAAWIYYAAEKRRVPVELTEELFARVRQAIADAKALAALGKCPPPLANDPRCHYCSAYPICLPGESAWWARRPVEERPRGGQLVLELLSATENPPFAAKDATPPEIRDAPRPPNDEGEILVVQKAGAHIGCRGDQFTISVDGAVLDKKPAHQLRSIYVYGAVQISTQAIETALELGIDVSYFSPAGRFIGLTRGLPASGVDARRGQYKLFEEPTMRLKLAAEVVRAKIHNQRVMLMRNGEVPEAALNLMAQMRDETSAARDMTTLLGLEGTAAAIYFEHFATMLGGDKEWKFDFTGRNRRPPRDPINALISIGYSMLAKELTGVCHTVGLDPFFGFMHQPRYGRPALALDLMEEFRALTADSVAISLINRNELGPEDFIRSASGTFLNERGRRAFWEAWFRRMDAEVTHPEFDYKMAYRRMLEVQARQLWRFVRGEATTYHGFTTR